MRIWRCGLLAFVDGAAVVDIDVVVLLIGGGIFSLGVLFSLDTKVNFIGRREQEVSIFGEELRGSVLVAGVSDGVKSVGGFRCASILPFSFICTRNLTTLSVSGELIMLLGEDNNEEIESEQLQGCWGAGLWHFLYASLGVLKQEGERAVGLIVVAPIDESITLLFGKNELDHFAKYIGLTTVT